MPLKQLCSDPVQLAQYRSPTVCPQRGQVWRGLRNDLLGASEAAQATGVCPYGKTPGDLIAAKCSRAVAQPTAAQQRGIRNEQQAVDRFLQTYKSTFKSVLSAKETGLWIYSGWPHLCASPDRLLLNSDGLCEALLEVKCYQDDPGEVLPEHVRLQVGRSCFEAAVALTCTVSAGSVTHTGHTSAPAYAGI